jgi:hypothetical protein
MKTIQKLSICLIALFALGGQVCVAQEPEQTYQEPETEVADNGVREALNDIRFAGSTSKEWADNDYIRAVRKFIDAYNNGEIEYPYLDEHKEYIQGKFVIADIVPSIIGGALIYIVFYDHPEQTFSAHVYSDVDEKTRTISNYDCRGLTNENIDLGLSQEDIMQFLKERPEHKLW